MKRDECARPYRLRSICPPHLERCAYRRPGSSEQPPGAAHAGRPVPRMGRHAARGPRAQPGGGARVSLSPAPSSTCSLLPASEFSQACQDKLLTLVYGRDPQKSVALERQSGPKMSEQRGVQVVIADYGKTESSFYEPLYVFLEEAGYVRNVNIRVAGYDFRLTPDMGGFMERTVALIEETYRENHNTPVHLVGHSNGPLYAQYLLTHTSQQWKNKYIHGFTPIAGNWPGQGWLVHHALHGL